MQEEKERYDWMKERSKQERHKQRNKQTKRKAKDGVKRHVRRKRKKMSQIICGMDELNGVTISVY
jgi:hypothetical protein